MFAFQHTLWHFRRFASLFEDEQNERITREKPPKIIRSIPIINYLELIKPKKFRVLAFTQKFFDL